MSRIYTNVQSLTAQRALSGNISSLSNSLERMSTGLRINRGKDDPAGLIASESLRSEIKSMNAAIGNAERADQVVNIAEGGLQEISTLLTDLQTLVTSSANEAGLSQSEKEANQLQIDSILSTIDRISGSTSFQGTKLLNGTYEIRASNIVAGISEYRVNAANFEGASLDVDVTVTASAQKAGFFLSTGSSALDLGGQTSSFVIEIGGRNGTRELTFASGTALSTVRDSINSFTDVTGVSAVVSGTTGLKLQSKGFGNEEFVSIRIVDDGGMSTAAGRGIYNLMATNFNDAAAAATADWDDPAATNGLRDSGQNLGATINGISAVGKGKSASISSDFLDVELSLTTAQSQTLGSVGAGGAPALSVFGRGAEFQLDGKVNSAGRVSMGINNVATRRLGSTDVGGFLDDLGASKGLNVVTGDLTDAQAVVEKAISQVSKLRGRLGVLQTNTIGASMRALGIAVENSSAAESSIRDADFAQETASLTRSQILVSAAANSLSLANSQPQLALQLLRG